MEIFIYSGKHICLAFRDLVTGGTKRSRQTSSWLSTTITRH